MSNSLIVIDGVKFQTSRENHIGKRPWVWSPLKRLITFKSKLEPNSPNVHINSCFNHIKNTQIIYEDT